MAQIEDELDEPKVRSAKALAHAATQVNADENDFAEVEFGDENLMAKTGLDKFAPKDKGVFFRVALLPDVLLSKKKGAEPGTTVPALSIWIHFVDKKGSYVCLSKRDGKGNFIGEPAECCKKLNNLSDKKQAAQCIIGSLAIRYTNVNPKDGKYVRLANGEAPPVEYEIGWVKLSRDGFRKVSSLVPEDGSIKDIDISITMKSNGIGFEYAAPFKCRFRQNPDLVAEIKELTAQYADGVALAGRMGKKATLLEWKAMLAGAAATTAADATIDSLDDLN
jgi:hypothetical protein